MSRLAEFRKLEQQLAAQLAQLDSLKNDDGLKKDIEFETKLRDLLEQYGCSLKDVINILDPHSASRKGAPAVPEKAVRRPRVVKVYKNPHSGEVVETKGGNHRTLKAWKAEHGSATVESWLAQ
ncbi:histone-like nucleoid-structuring protein, MvaT/MvaU family [Pseudomonas syringae]|uniref:histone-like nucleoid-structuring protein, MvaT/MvaU family n=1 Tax=Pseudomonas syringae TaxID=317 RepID=UPI003F773F03